MWKLGVRRVYCTPWAVGLIVLDCEIPCIIKSPHFELKKRTIFFSFLLQFLANLCAERPCLLQFTKCLIFCQFLIDLFFSSFFHAFLNFFPWQVFGGFYVYIPENPEWSQSTGLHSYNSTSFIISLSLYLLSAFFIKFKRL